MYTIDKNINNEIVINKSRFICYLIKVKNEEDISNNINELKKLYKDATHYCYSYIIGNTKRFNDDGEPGGTAGMPILNVLENNNLNNVLCVVIRYFGGIKLGAGGLVRAYTKSVSQTIINSKLNELCIGKNITISFSYDNTKTIDNILKDISINDKNFDEIITYNFDISDNEYNDIYEKLKNIINNIDIKENIIIEKK